MTREEAIKIIEQRVAIDRQNITNNSKPKSDFDKFISEQDEALDVALEIMKSDIVSVDESPEVTEICPHCKSEITLHWNVKDRGYRAYCPVCGERLTLCSACRNECEPRKE